MHIVTQGLVLRETNYKEADKILTVLTREGGKRCLLYTSDAADEL